MISHEPRPTTHDPRPTILTIHVPHDPHVRVPGLLNIRMQPSSRLATMNKIITLAIAAVFAMTAVSASAQVAGPGQKADKALKMHRKGMHRMMQSLNLSKGQKDQLKGIREQRRAQMLALRSSNQPAAAKKERAKAIARESRAKVMSVLTPAQKAKLEAMKARFRANHPGARKHGKPVIHP